LSLILISSILIRIVAMGWSILLLSRTRDWRMGFMTLMLSLMALRQTLTLKATTSSWNYWVLGSTTELPGLVVSVIGFPGGFLFGENAGQSKEDG